LSQLFLFIENVDAEWVQWDEQMLKFGKDNAQLGMG
jgi:hypothetical protein